MIKTDKIKYLDKYWVYYDEIVNYKYNDIISYQLINWYKDLIFSNISKKMINYIDEHVYLYISSYQFRCKFKIYYQENNNNNNNNIEVNFMRFCKKYDKSLYLEFTISHWL